MNEIISINPKHSIRMTSQEIAELTGKRHDNVKRTIETLAESGVIVHPQFEDGPGTDAMGRLRPAQVYVFDFAHKRDSFVVVAQLSPEFTAALVDRWQQLEAQVASPALPSNLREALLLAADLEAKREEAEARAMEAERTKTWIGSKREATAMATASAEYRRAEKLAIELDRSKEYATIKRMQLLYHGQEFNWRLLKRTATEMGIPPIDVFDPNFDTVKGYHKDVWREAYALDIPA